MKRSFLLLVMGLLAASAAAQSVPSDSSALKLPDTSEKEGALHFGVKAKTEKAVPKRDENDAKGSTEVSFVYTNERLSNNFGTWHESSINVVHKFTQRKVFYGSYVETERFRKRDRQANAGIYIPLDSKWTLLLEAGASPTHRVLPKWSALGQIERAVGNGWIASAGFRRTNHDAAKVNIGKLGVEKYWGMNRAAFSLSINNLEGVGTSPSSRIQYNRYYGNESNLGIGFSIGKEVENIGNNTILRSDVHNISFSGKHVFSNKWGVIYGYSFHRQGDIYNRRGLSIGIRYKF